ncbi:MAG: DUF58 domain-containing protein, partial [Candidatus Sumerlaeota bacterium]|nr:DUF58 domain-containing protein [Candidatus Sumerlaeota bacterium]
VTSTLLSPELLARLEKMELVSRKIFRGRMKGERRSPRKGQSVEFADFRNYVPGDDPRFIDWNTYGRLEKLFIKLFVEEEDLFVYILVDTSGSMAFGNPSKLLFAQRLAAALGYVSLIGLDRVAIGAFARGLGHTLPPSRGKGQVRKFFAFIGEFQAEGQTSLDTAARLFLLRYQRPGMLILISDFLDKGGYEHALSALAARKLEICCAQVLSPEEINPPVAGDLRLRDSEDDATVEITVTDRLLKAYRHGVEGYCAGLSDYCRKRGITFLPASSADSIEDTVLRALRGAGVLG